ncbi:MAG: M1 family metallopeptidase [Chloroflexota bacterium]
MKRLLRFALLLTLGCTVSSAQVPTIFPTATTVRSQPETLVPTAERTVRIVNTLETTATPTQAPTVVAQVPTSTTEPTATATATAKPGCVTSDDLTQHQVEARVDYEAKTVRVKQTIVYRNRTGETLDRLVLNVEPNRWLDVFTLNTLTLTPERNPGVFTLTGRRMDVLLPGNPLEPDCDLVLHLDFNMTMPPIIGGVEAFRGYFGHSPRQINLGHWLPTVVPYRDGEWLHRETIFIGEQIVLDLADWYVTIDLVNAPPGTTVAAPGMITQLDETSSRFFHTGGREFAASISHVFRHHEAMTESGVQVDVYSLPDARIWKEDTEEWIDGGEYAAKITAESTDLYSEKFGPYPHGRIVIVQGDFPDGMEFSGFGFVSTDWFVSYEGSPQSYLMLITVHEVAHQWWYDLVGNDQAQSPWLDEALSTYSEYIYIEAYYPEIADWWWFFRVNRLNPEGFVNSSVYEFSAIRPYINAVYLRGVMMLHDMRTVLGDDGFYLWLRDYADANAGDIATADSLWEQLTPEQFAATAVIRTAFLRQTN